MAEKTYTENELYRINRAFTAEPGKIYKSDKGLFYIGTSKKTVEAYNRSTLNKTSDQWIADKTIYDENFVLFTTNEFYSGTNQKKFKIGNSKNTWSELDYVSTGGSGSAGVISITDNGNGFVVVNNADSLNPIIEVVFTAFPLSDGKILIGDATNFAVEVTPSENATISNTGVIILADEFQLAMISNFRFLTKN